MSESHFSFTNKTIKTNINQQANMDKTNMQSVSDNDHLTDHFQQFLHGSKRLRFNYISFYI